MPFVKPLASATALVFVYCAVLCGSSNNTRGIMSMLCRGFVGFGLRCQRSSSAWLYALAVLHTLHAMLTHGIAAIFLMRSVLLVLWLAVDATSVLLGCTFEP
jgi:hypothetical protein